MIPFNCTFIIIKDKSLYDGKLQCRIKWDRCKSSFSINVGYRVDYKNWNKDTFRCIPKTYNGKKKVPSHQINAKIEFIENIINSIFQNLNDIPTINEVKNEVYNHLNNQYGNKKELLIYYYDKFIEERKKERQWERNTELNYLKLRLNLCQFNKDLQLKDITQDFIIDFNQYLFNKNNNHTINEINKKLKSFFKWLINKNLLNEKVIEKQPTYVIIKKPVIFLTWEELQKIIKEPPISIIEEYSKLLFLFCCFTSLRYSDAVNLKWIDIQNDTIKVVTEKTNDSLSIELNKWSKYILNEVEQLNPYHSSIETIFKVKTISSHNKCIHRICKRCGINDIIKYYQISGNQKREVIKHKWELISSHCGRKTFICNALMLNIPIATVIQWTGHKDYQAMKPYIAITDKQKQKEMNKFDNLINIE